MKLADYQSCIEASIRGGASFADIEAVIEAAPLTSERKAALWLWAWTFVEVAVAASGRSRGAERRVV